MHGSAVGLAEPPQLMVRVCAQDAKSVRPCSPPALERCLGGRTTDLYSGCGIAYAGTAPPFSIDFGVSFPCPPCARSPRWALLVACRSILWLVCRGVLQKGKDLRRVRRQHEEHHVRSPPFCSLPRTRFRLGNPDGAHSAPDAVGFQTDNPAVLCGTDVRALAPLNFNGINRLQWWYLYKLGLMAGLKNARAHAPMHTRATNTQARMHAHTRARTNTEHEQRQ
jgi:hypothetical protein